MDKGNMLEPDTRYSILDNPDGIEEKFPSYQILKSLFLRKRNAKYRRSPAEILHDFLALAEEPIGPTRMFAMHGTSYKLMNSFFNIMRDKGLMKKAPRMGSAGGPGTKYVFITTVKGLKIRDKIKEFYEDTDLEAFIVRD